jgi:hypothetical protein
VGLAVSELVSAQLSLFYVPRCVPIDPHGAPCFECGIDTIESGEYYLVREKVWLAACAWNAKASGFDFLCIGCLESRLGRRLQPDHLTECELNHLPATARGWLGGSTDDRVKATRVSPGRPRGDRARRRSA